MSSTRLWFSRPAANWNEALPLGNGRMGAMVFGGVHKELIQLNDDTLWSGRPMSYLREGSASHLPEIRRLIFAGKEAEATKLAETLMGDPPFQHAYQPLGDLHIEFRGSGEPDEYRRELDLRDGMFRMECVSGGVRVQREAFISHPDQVFALRITSSLRGALSFQVRIDSPHPHSVRQGDASRLVLSGMWVGDGKPRDWTAPFDGQGIRFEAALAIQTDGVVEVRDGKAGVARATTATVYLACATSFVNYQDISGDPSRCLRQLDRAAAKGYSGLRQAHTRDFRRHMNRVSLDLGPGDEATPIDERLKRTPDAGLCALYAQFGRYLLLSSSRPGTQPANLQGIWNKDTAPAWGSKWTVNINTEMNYWPAEQGALPECHQPLFGLLKDLMVTGSATAQAHYGARGWVVHHNADLWRGAAPVDGVWGVWPMAAAWMSLHAWEHYEFSLDRAFLRRTAWPLMKGAAEFLLDFLVPAPEGSPVAGRLVTCPSHSPENAFRKRDGSVHQFTYAATMDLMIIRALFERCLKAAALLGADAQTAGQIRQALERLAPLQVSPRDGRLQEWIEDYDEPEPGHRHMSHFFALHPGAEISPKTTPELAAALRKSLEHRLANGGGGTGWSRAWVVNFMARLGLGDEALKHLRLLLERSTLPNMFDNHPPFQIDGNFGGSAGIMEMLLQSHLGEIHLLPALPSEWKTGSFTGLRARGAVEVDAAWTDGRLARVQLKLLKPGEHQVRWREAVVRVKGARGEVIALDGALNRTSPGSGRGS